MGYQDFNVLVVDDDKSFAESLKEAVSRSGFRCYVVHSPEEALNYAKLQDVHIMIIDCMLPKMNGLELVKKIQENLSTQPHLFLMSGIFKDRQFVNSALNKTGATDFLIKPFDLKALITKLESLLSGLDESTDDFNPLVRLYLDREVKMRKMIKLINGSEGLHNYDLPWVFQLLISIKATGHLNIACTNGDIAGVGFAKGQIVQVNIKNESSLLGLLLVEQGYLTRKDLDQALNSNTDNKRIGQYLVEENYVSPHAINIVLKEQLVWRMKRLIADSNMELNFVKAEEVAPIAEITPSDFLQFILDTVEHTIRPDWLKAHYLPLMQNEIKLNSEMSEEINRVRMMPFVSRNLPAIEGLLSRGTSLDELLSKNPSIETNILRLVHFFNIMEFIKVSQVHQSLNFDHQTKRLQKLDVELEQKNYFERLGVSQSAKDGDIRKAYFDLAKVLHPDKLGSSTPEDIRALSERVFEKIQIAYDTLKKTERRDEYMEKLQASQSERLMEGDQLFEKAKAFIFKGQYSQGRNALIKAAKLNPNSPEIKIHLVWSDLKITKQPSEAFLSDVDKRLNQIPIESRDSAAYYHCRGLYFGLLGDKEKAKKYFKTAINLDAQFISARREMTQISTQKKDFKNILNADLKDVVGLLFKK